MAILRLNTDHYPSGKTASQSLLGWVGVGQGRVEGVRDGCRADVGVRGEVDTGMT